MIANRPHSNRDYEIFLQGVDDVRNRLVPRRLPPQLPPEDAVLWLAGYRMEQEEQRLIAKLSKSAIKQ